LAKGHLQLQSLEFVRHVGLDVCAHLLASPLLDSVESLVDIHLGGSLWFERDCERGLLCMCCSSCTVCLWYTVGASSLCAAVVACVVVEDSGSWSWSKRWCMRTGAQW
jgi:hypothetical protein